MFVFHGDKKATFSAPAWQWWFPQAPPDRHMHPVPLARAVVVPRGHKPRSWLRMDVGSWGFPAAGQAPFWSARSSLLCLKFLLTSPGCLSPSRVPGWGRSRGSSGEQGDSLLLHVRQGHCSVPLLTRRRCGKMKRQSSVWSLHFYFGEGKCQRFICKIWARVRRKSWILRSKWQITRATGAVTVYKVARNNQWNYSLVLHGCLSAVMEIRYHQNCWKNLKITVGTILGYDSSI